VVTESPDELEKLRISAAFGADRADTARSKGHRDLKKACDEGVGGFLKGLALDVGKAFDPEPNTAVNL
jgi:hypothetical protein